MSLNTAHIAHTEALCKVQGFFILLRVQRLVCSAAPGQVIESGDKIECQRANGNGENRAGWAKYVK